jgi:hypothetical protein
MFELVWKSKLSDQFQILNTRRNKHNPLFILCWTYKAHGKCKMAFRRPTAQQPHKIQVNCVYLKLLWGILDKHMNKRE